MSDAPAIWLDGKPAKSLPLPDRGLEFGDGLFETLLLLGNRVLFGDLHLARLKRGLEVLHFPACITEVARQVQSVAVDIGADDRRWSALRVTVTRGTGPRGYAPPLYPTPRIIIARSELDPDYSVMAPPAVLAVAAVRWPTQPAFAGLKHLNRLEQVVAAREYRLAGADEAVMLNQSGEPVSVVAGNLFMVDKKRLLTAPLHRCGIAGTRRELIMQRWGPALGLTIEETTLSLQQLLDADELFYSNSLVGLRPVGRFAERSWASHEVCEALYRLYREDIA